MRKIPKPVAEAHALSAFRILPSGEGRQYSATTFPRDPWQGCERMIRTASKLGYLVEPKPGVDGYAVLDVLDNEGGIVQDFTITSDRAFQYLKRKLNWRVEDDEA